MISWLDDVRTVPPLGRLLVQLTAVGFGLAVLPTDATLFHGTVPLVADRLFAAVAWLWFIDLFNFMDGIDGLAGSETIAISLGGLAVATTVLPVSHPYLSQAALLAGAAAGFLYWNWQPARIFLGDVGSATLGYLLGWLMLQLWVAGFWAAALLLPMYFVTDATITLFRRLARGAKVWEAHREHYYQRAVQRGMSHRGTVHRVNIGNALLALAALASIQHPLPALSLGLAITGVLLWSLQRGSSA